MNMCTHVQTQNPTQTVSNGRSRMEQESPNTEVGDERNMNQAELNRSVRTVFELSFWTNDAILYVKA